MGTQEGGGILVKPAEVGEGLTLSCVVGCKGKSYGLGKQKQIR